VCGISGIIPLSKDITKEQILEVMKHLILENRSRGGDATGTATWDKEKNEILVCKQADEAKDFVPNLTVEHIWGPTMGHNRAKTRGDPADPENNHPMFGENFCLIHNGVVPSMKNLEGYKYKGQCDTEVLLSYIEQYGVREAIPKIDGSAAIAIMSPEDKTFYLYRHTSPIIAAYYPGKAFVFSSTEYPLKRIGSILGIEKLWGIFTPQLMSEFDEGQLFSIHMDTFEIQHEIIKIPSSTIYSGNSCDIYNRQNNMGYD